MTAPEAKFHFFFLDLTGRGTWPRACQYERVGGRPVSQGVTAGISTFWFHKEYDDI